MSKGKVVEQNGLAIREEQTAELQISGAQANAQHEIQSAIIIAQRFKRNEDSAFQKLMKSASRASFSEDALYSFPRGGSTVSGPSVNMAREAARIWGNIRYGMEVLRDDEESRLIRAFAWDVETNTKVSADDDFSKLIQRKDKATGTTKWISPDERDLRELTNRRGAILVRNCILQLLPKDLIEEAMEKVRETLRSGAQADPDASRKNMIVKFGELNITPEMLELKLGHAIGLCTPDEVAELRTIYASIRDGNSSWTEYTTQKSEKKEPEKGTLDLNNFKPSEEPNRGHDDDVPLFAKEEKAQEQSQKEVLKSSAKETTIATPETKTTPPVDERKMLIEKIQTYPATVKKAAMKKMGIDGRLDLKEKTLDDLIFIKETMDELAKNNL
jgi:hypothetical protein